MEQKGEKTPVTVPFIAFESAMARMERSVKRLWIENLIERAQKSEG